MTDRQTNFLLTDLYQLAMMQAYNEAGESATAVFEFFVRKLPEGRNFLVAAGLEQALSFLENLRPSDDDLAWLDQSGHFSRELIDQLRSFRFTGDVDAMVEGTVFFPDEPILRVTAPLPQAQYVETRLINLLHFQTLIASKAARMVLAAEGRMLVDFGLRRAHGAEAGLLAARASYIAGFAGSANVLAEREFGVPAFGTMAHSFVQAFDSEAAAFEAFAKARPENLVLLIDTYDTEAGARRVVEIAPKLRAMGITIRAVRLDSGDLGALAKSVRRILDAGGCGEVTIFASGGLDETEIARFLAMGAPIDGFGVGTSLTTSSDAPALDCAYKLQEYAGQARRKRSEGKATWPGRKQVWRRFDDAGRMAGDTVTTKGDPQGGTPLLEPVMRAGQRLSPAPSLSESRSHAAQAVASLPQALRGIEQAEPYKVEISASLRALADEVDRFIDRSAKRN
ncbi:nicotinate phosphoribosyltransferase [Marimonas arenosa]|uniref:Nicotinate phosphoribosyltransferase n=1 Tax=Marimonas arenosa TaxID=1795305 RepID=A0AAE4B512_9RHOB|nr:nicotinate phosphoribosyltransferase [Marimonas arenosa]MDQ2089899.1 nicotinate phosphoribosyltransferase [Marimonas arenosa]